MELFERILCNIITRDVIPILDLDWEKLIEMRCCYTLEKIHRIISDETLDDPECFQKIEAIICALEDEGLDGGGRHDF